MRTIHRAKEEKDHVACYEHTVQMSASVILWGGNARW